MWNKLCLFFHIKNSKSETSTPFKLILSCKTGCHLEDLCNTLKKKREKTHIAALNLWAGMKTLVLMVPVSYLYFFPILFFDLSRQVLSSQVLWLPPLSLLPHHPLAASAVYVQALDHYPSFPNFHDQLKVHMKKGVKCDRERALSHSNWAVIKR